MRVKNWLNAHQFEKNYEKNYSPSLTVPDQSLTVRQILDRYARGLNINDGKVPIYDGEDDILEGRNWQAMDLVEREAFKQAVSDELFELQRQRLAAESLQNTPPAPKQSAPTEPTDLKVNPDGSTSPIS